MVKGTAMDRQVQHDDLQAGDEVVVPWGVDEVLGKIIVLYGDAPRIQVVIELQPELSSFVVAETTTITLPLSAIRRSRAAA